MARATRVTDAEVEKRLAAIEHARVSIAHLAPDRNLADELIADRRVHDHGNSPIVPGHDDLHFARKVVGSRAGVDF